MSERPQCSSATLRLQHICYSNTRRLEVVLYLQQAEVTRERVDAMHQSSIDGVEDMSALAELHEAAIMHNLYQRHRRTTSIILAAVNPYKRISGLYDLERVDLYSKHHLGELPPHIFAVANECYRCIWKRHDSQCVLISGESGAGKTESTKLLLQFLSVMSQKSAGTPQSEKTTRVEQAIVQSSPIMEAFGNAKTVYNNNSSRFGKFIQLHFSESGNIQGGCVIDYLLEKNRVVRQNPGERNYHIFYALLAGANKEHKRMKFCIVSFQENGHAKTNGDASPAAEEANKADVQANGSTPTEEAPKEEGEKVEGAEANGEKEPAATNGEASAKPEEGTPSTSEDGKQKKKRFSFKKPSFKLSGFSFKKTKKESEEAAEEGAAAAAAEPAEGEKAASEEAAAEETKPAEAGEEGAKEAAAEEPEAEEEAKAEEGAAAAAGGGEEKPAEASPTEPETAASPEAAAATAE
ncbi:unconventional myosin-X-like protein [Lates japonicus]|uniref:Unconventional myosin-X-like protein n=1 Tax=Lates japonicus TaxID=270547 RepID=A0AAD3M5T4_LATJO|nr:unconventional myosin-X-like protein [Lates japonicus]